jgi:hypothetical protein
MLYLEMLIPLDLKVISSKASLKIFKNAYLRGVLTA